MALCCLNHFNRFNLTLLSLTGPGHRIRGNAFDMGTTLIPPPRLPHLPSPPTTTPHQPSKTPTPSTPENVLTALLPATAAPPLSPSHLLGSRSSIFTAPAKRTRRPHPFHARAMGAGRPRNPTAGHGRDLVDAQCHTYTPLRAVHLLG